MISYSSVLADTFHQKDGTVTEGKIASVLADTVFMELVSGDVAEIEKSHFNANALSKVDAWIEANPEKVNIYTKWDVQPIVKRSKKPDLPETLNIPDFKGLVSLQVVLNEKGRVIHGEVRKSTHPELETPALESAKSWIFTPAKIANLPVKAKIHLSFKYEYDGNKS